MAVNNVNIIKDGGPTQTWQAEDRTTSSQTTNLLPGEPVKKGGTGGNFVIALATGDPEVAVDEFYGIVRRQSTETSTVDGTVEVASLIPGVTIMRAFATTPTNIDTDAELLAIIGDWVTFDVTGAGTNGPTGVFTVDENEGDDPNVHGLKIITGNIVKGTLDFAFHVNASWVGPTN